MKKGRKLASSKDVDLSSSEDDSEEFSAPKKNTKSNQNDEFAKPNGIRYHMIFFT